MKTTPSQEDLSTEGTGPGIQQAHGAGRSRQRVNSQEETQKQNLAEGGRGAH